MTLEEALTVLAAYTHVPYGDMKRVRVVREAQKIVYAEAEKIRLRIEVSALKDKMPDPAFPLTLPSLI